jgi:hypothetical protein
VTWSPYLYVTKHNHGIHTSLSCMKKCIEFKFNLSKLENLCLVIKNQPNCIFALVFLIRHASPCNLKGMVVLPLFPKNQGICATKEVNVPFKKIAKDICPKFKN